MTFIQSIIYGFISGFSEFIPVSSQAHSYIMRYIFGVDGAVPLFDIMAHLGMLVGLFLSCQPLFSRIKRDQNIMQRGRRRREHRPLPPGIYDLHIVRTALLPLIVIFFLTAFLFQKKVSLISVAISLILNGIFLIGSDYVPQGNKDGHHVTVLDSILMGILGGLSGFPGISRVGMNMSYSIYRGASKQSGYDWALLLSVPAIAGLIIFDIICAFGSGLGIINFIQILFALVTFLFSVLGSFSAIVFIKYMIVSVGLSGFAFYSWGAALFSFMIYLLT